MASFIFFCTFSDYEGSSLCCGLDYVLILHLGSLIAHSPFHHKDITQKHWYSRFWGMISFGKKPCPLPMPQKFWVKTQNIQTLLRRPSFPPSPPLPTPTSSLQIQTLLRRSLYLKEMRFSYRAKWDIFLILFIIHLAMKYISIITDTIIIIVIIAFIVIITWGLPFR